MFPRSCVLCLSWSYSVIRSLAPGGGVRREGATGARPMGLRGRWRRTGPGSGGENQLRMDNLSSNKPQPSSPTRLRTGTLPAHRRGADQLHSQVDVPHIRGATLELLPAPAHAEASLSGRDGVMSGPYDGTCATRGRTMGSSGPLWPQWSRTWVAAEPGLGGRVAVARRSVSGTVPA